jgi:ribosomal protein S12 methylthiotransferase accessory factor
MKETLQISFPGGKKVDIGVGDFLINTDQSIKRGGEASAPEPFDLFLASIAGCAGIFALGFCHSRDISTIGLGLEMDWEKEQEPPHAAKVTFRLTLPEGFPKKYQASIQKAINLCTVKHYIHNPPEFSIEVISQDS